MNIKNFLINTIKDMYNEYLICLNIGNESNLEITDDLLLQIYDSVYSTIVDSKDISEENLRNIVQFLVKSYINSGNNNFGSFTILNDDNIDGLVYRFKNDCTFGTQLVKNYFEFLKKQQEDKSKESYAITNANDILRSVITNIYNYYISLACDRNTALMCTFLFFETGYDPLYQLKSTGISDREEFNIRQYILVLIYCDLYEDALANNDGYDENFKYKIRIAIEILKDEHNVPFFLDKSFNKEVLSKFLNLCENKETRLSNRNKSIQNGEIKILEKINPLCIIDSITS